MFSSFTSYFNSTQPVTPRPANNDTPIIDSPGTIVDTSESIDSTTIQSPEYSDITQFDVSSPDISPIKNSRENGMFETSSSYSEDSFNSKNLSDINNTDTQKTVFIYLFDKIRSLESCIVQSTKDNEDLRTRNKQLSEKIDSMQENSKSFFEKLDSIEDKFASLEMRTSFDNHIVCNDLNAIFHKLRDDDDTEKTKTESESVAESVLDAVIDAAVDIVSPSRAHPPPPAPLSKDPTCSPLCKEKIDEIQQELGKLRVDFEIEKDFQISESDQTNARLHQLDRKIIKTSQYTRRQNLVIDGIPDHVPQEDLERVSIDIINKLDFPVSTYEVEGCHRLPRKNKNLPAPTIIRFTNRKIKEYCIRNRWRLPKLGGNWKLSMRENLETENETVVEQCEILKREKFIDKFVISNGFVKVFYAKGGKSKKIEHPSDLDELLTDLYDIYPDYSNV